MVAARYSTNRTELVTTLQRFKLKHMTTAVPYVSVFVFADVYTALGWPWFIEFSTTQPNRVQPSRTGQDLVCSVSERHECGTENSSVARIFTHLIQSQSTCSSVAAPKENSRSSQRTVRTCTSSKTQNCRRGGTCSAGSPIEQTTSTQSIKD